MELERGGRLSFELGFASAAAFEELGDLFAGELYV